MADSDAVRSARYRRHRQNDHSMCKHLRNMPVPAPEIRNGIADLDPVAELRNLADRLETAHIADPANVGVARELRLTLSALMGLPGGGVEDDPLAELWASMPPS